MNLKWQAQDLLDEIKKIDADIEITFDKNEITIYWENLRVDCDEKTISKALQSIKNLITLNAYFE
jgi:hypothetical protein